MNYLVVVTGGGTGGHVFPGLAVARELRMRYGAEIVWIGSRSGIERRLVKDSGLSYQWVLTGKLRRYPSVRTFSDVLKVPAGILLAIAKLRRLRPAVVFSKGGYVAVPVVIAAWILGIPVAAHESDLDPGLTTRISARVASRILVTYYESLAYFAAVLRERTVVSGNPVRPEIIGGDAERGRGYLGLSGGRPVVLFLGGSLGSLQINALVAGVLQELLQRCDVVHQTGEHGPIAAARPPAEESAGRYVAQPFFAAEFPDVLAAADLVVSRAGAGTIWENLTAGKPSVLIPLGTGGSRGDQLRNAELCRRRGLAEVLAPEEAQPERLLPLIVGLIESSDRRRKMAQAAAQAARPEAAAEIASVVHELATGTRVRGSV